MEARNEDLAKAAHHKGSSQADDSDMRRMGRTQELRVSHTDSMTIYDGRWLTHLSAQLQIRRHCRYAATHDFAIAIDRVADRWMQVS